MDSPILYIFSGLPGVGKTTLAQRLSAERNACYVRIDTIEQALREMCDFKLYGEGYGLAYRIAADNLRLGLDVVADSCNSIELTRNAWVHVAAQEGAKHVNIEVCCSDQAEHRRRIESRVSTVSGLNLPTWSDVVSREYEVWGKPRLEIDTANCSVDVSSSYLLMQIGKLQENQF